MQRAVLVAVGGNSLIRSGQRGTIREQFENARVTASSIAEIAVLGYRIVITHGNGPQVGSQLLRSEAASMQTYSQPLDVCVASTQGEIGYILLNSLQSELRKRKIPMTVAVVLTRVAVKKDDPAYSSPTKPIGPFYHKETAEQKRSELGWDIVEDAARGYRRVVPSPAPVEIMEIDVIRKCIAGNIIVIAAGGGGIPVVFENGDVNGVEAVIDKDRSSALLASTLGMDRLVISTNVEYVYIDYKKQNQKAITEMSVDEAERFLKEGHFLNGSMRPKIEAAIDFIGRGGEEVVITDPAHLLAGLRGDGGTHIRREVARKI